MQRGFERRVLDRDFPERRVLDPTIRADVFHYESAYEVRAGEGRIGPVPLEAAYATAHIHNVHNGHEALTDRREVGTP